MQKKLTLFLATLFVSSQIIAQKINYSVLEKKDFYKYKFEVIAKSNDHILIYKASYSESSMLLNNQNSSFGQNLFSDPDMGILRREMGRALNNPILESRICIYDNQMQIIQETVLPLQNDISGVHFLVYKDFFYLFYQYLKNGVVHCMAAKIGMDGTMIGSPFDLDDTKNIGSLNYQSQIYTIIHSENKKYIMAFKMLYQDNVGYNLTSVLYNENLQELHRFSGNIAKSDFLAFTEYNLDNNGNLLFIGQTDSWQKDDYANSFLGKLDPNAKAVSYYPITSIGFYTDYLRMTIDNVHEKYILASCSSKSWGGDINGMGIAIVNADDIKNINLVNVNLSDNLMMGTEKNSKSKFNGYFLNNIQLRNDGGFIIEAQDLYISPELHLYNRWNYLQYFIEPVASDFVFYDPYETTHYYPWKAWRYMAANRDFGSNGFMFMSFDPNGKVEWGKMVNNTQEDRYYNFVGYKSFVYNQLIYFLFDEKIHKQTYLVAQSINAKGELNTDTQFKEHMEIPMLDKNYFYYPRLANQVSANEVIIPFSKGSHVGLMKMEF